MGEQNSAAALPIPSRADQGGVGSGQAPAERYYLGGVTGTEPTPAWSLMIDVNAVGQSTFEASLRSIESRVLVIFDAQEDARNSMVHWVDGPGLQGGELFQGPAPRSWIATPLDLERRAVCQPADDPLKDLASLVEDIQALRPLAVSDEMRALARRAAAARTDAIVDDDGIAKWARKLAESSSDADD